MAQSREDERVLVSPVRPLVLLDKLRVAVRQPEYSGVIEPHLDAAGSYRSRDLYRYRGL